MILPPGLTLIKEVSTIDMQEIEPIMKLEDLSRYNLDPKDFFIIKNRNEEIVAFGRIHTIGDNIKELSSLWVDPDLRGQKIGLYLSKQLISHKKEGDELFLATRTSLEQYYAFVGFNIIDNQYMPSRFEKTAEWAKSNNIDFIIMKYVK